jgi:FtsH ternary system domain X7
LLLGMSDPPKFTIRRLTPEEKPTPKSNLPEKQPEQTPPVSSKTPTPQPASDISTGGYFRSATSVLAFLGSVFGSRLSETATVRRTPQGTWWAEIAITHERIAPLIWTVGGRPFTCQNKHWIPLSISGDLPPKGTNTEKLDVSTWEIVDLAELLASASLPPSRYHGATVVDVITPGSLGRWVLSRTTALGLDVTLTPALLQPLNNKQQKDSGVLLIQLRAVGNRIISPALVQRLTCLPYTIVATSSTDTEKGRILVDVRQRLSLAPSLIEPMIPENEIWVLGTADVGNWRIMTTGNQIDGLLLLDAPQLPPAQSPLFPKAQPPKLIPVQLVPRPGTGRQVDAVLLDDTELSWLRNLLMGRPIGEMAFILPGAGYHLLTAPGGLPSQIPLGIPLVCIGPGALYLELGKDFYPSLPDAARQQCFNLNSQTAVAIARNQTYRFNTAQMTPAWALWVGDTPKVQERLSAQGKKLLNSISPQLQNQESKKGILDKIFKKPKQVEPVEGVGILEQAQQAELKGDLVKAATLLEKGGYSGQAGRLYERIVTGGK